MSRARDLSRLSNPTNFTVDVANSRVGLGSTSPTAKLAVSGIVSATAFYGDGSNLEGVASAGLGTALSDEGAASVIYYTDKTLSVTGNTTVDVPDASSSNVAYTQYQEIDVQSGVDFIVADGDEFIPDILGLSTTSSGLLSGGGGSIRADNYLSKSGGAPTFSAGIVVTGVSTLAAVTGTTGTFSGNVSIGGTLTYEDVTNIDSVGIITANSGIEVAGIVTAKAGAAVTYYGDGSGLTGVSSWEIRDTWLYYG